MEEIDNKIEEEFEKFSINENIFYCKICGDPFIEKQSKCDICNIHICSNCKSHGLCLNCYVNLKESIRKKIKLFPLLMLTLPIYLIFLLLYGWKIFLGAIISIEILILFYNQKIKKELKSQPKLYLDEKWFSIINSEDYSILKNEHDKSTYIPEEIKFIYEKRKEKRIEDLVNWAKIIDKKDNLSDNNKIEKKEGKENIDKTAKIGEFNKKVNVNGEEIEKSQKIELKGKCQNCGSKLIDGTFCIECNIRICPECGNTTNPFSKRCICGYEFKTLKELFN